MLSSLGHCVAELRLSVEKCSSDGLQCDMLAARWIMSVKHFLCISGFAASTLHGDMLKGTGDAKQIKTACACLLHTI